MIHITPQTAAAAYELLKTTKPFAQWKLPPADDIEFKIALDKKEQGHYNRYVKTDHHWISVSAASVSSLGLLLPVMAHEMLHLFQGINKLETANTEHNAEFSKIGREVAIIHGWDIKAF